MTACKQIVRKYGHWLFFTLTALLTVYLDVYVSRFIIDGDASEVLHRAWCIAQQKSLFIPDYHFTTELCLFDISAIFALLFRLTDNWTLVRILGTIIAQVLYVSGFLYLCRQIGVRKSRAVVAAGFLLLPFSTVYARIVLYHAYYLLFMAYTFWMMGLTVRLVQNEQPRRQAVPAIALGLLWLMVGLNGIRHMMILGMPLLAFTFVALLQTLQNYRTQDGRLMGPEPFRNTKEVRLTAVLAASLLCFVVGYLLYKLWLQPAFHVYDASVTFFRPNWGPEHYTELLNGWLVAIGVRNTSAPLVGIRGVSLAAALIGFGTLLVLSLKSFFGRKESFEEKFAGSMFAALFLVNTLIFIFESGEAGGRLYQLYYIPVAVMAFLVLAVELNRYSDNSTSAARKLVTLLVCGCLLFQGAYSAWFIRADKHHLDQWDGLAYTRMDTIDQFQDCIDFMQTQGYTHALIDHWYANAMMEATDGSLKVCPLQVDFDVAGIVTLGRWGTSEEAFLPDNAPPTTIIFVKKERSAAFAETFPDAPRLHEGWVFDGYAFPTDQIH